MFSKHSHMEGELSNSELESLSSMMRSLLKIHPQYVAWWVWLLLLCPVAGHLRSRCLIFWSCHKTPLSLLECLTHSLTGVITPVCSTFETKDIRNLWNQTDLSSSLASPSICFLTLDNYLVFLSFGFLTSHKMKLIINAQFIELFGLNNI